MLKLGNERQQIQVVFILETRDCTIFRASDFDQALSSAEIRESCKSEFVKAVLGAQIREPGITDANSPYSCLFVILFVAYVLRSIGWEMYKIRE